jgi:phosphoribosylformimino-5-aminoimidazole carboxamide ribotide isomerase
MMGGVNVEATQALAEAVNIPIIASGGMHTLQDVQDLHTTGCKGISGAILGRSIYEGTIVLGKAQGWLDSQVR